MTGRGLVLGVKFYELGETVPTDRVIVGDRNRETIDRLLGGVPVEIRTEVAQFFAPFLENNEPAQRGTYDQVRYGGQPVILWWKWAYVMPDPVN